MRTDHDEAQQRLYTLRWFSRLLRAMTDNGLHNATQAAVLFAIAADPGRSTRRIAEELDISRATATRAIAALVEAGKATNRVDPRDNRLRIVDATKDGNSAIAAITDATGILNNE